jgi:periplasmic copper chaperone A
MKRSMRGLFALLPIVLSPAIAGAHVTIENPQAVVGSYYRAVFDVPHGCGASATTALQIVIPAGIVMAKPMPKPGWTIEIIKEKLEKPVQNEGHELTERVKEVVWKGGRLSSDEFDSFTLMVRLTATSGPLPFPTVQTCEVGETRWVEIPPEGKTSLDVRYPAPSVLLVPAGAPQ